jgi:hypothetical protein
MASVVILLSSGATVMNASIRGIAQHLGDLGDGELGDRDLVGIDAGFRQDHAEQGDVDRGSADDTDAVACEITDLLDFRFGGFLPVLARSAGRRPENHDVLAQDRDSPGSLGHFLIGTNHRHVGFASTEKPNALNRARGGEHGKPNRAALIGKGLRQFLNQFLVVAARRTNGNAQGRWPPQQKGRAGDGCEDHQGGGQQQKRRAPVPAPGRRACVQTV